MFKGDSMSKLNEKNKNHNLIDFPDSIKNQVDQLYYNFSKGFFNPPKKLIDLESTLSLVKRCKDEFGNIPKSKGDLADIIYRCAENLEQDILNFIKKL